MSESSNSTIYIEILNFDDNTKIKNGNIELKDVDGKIIQAHQINDGKISLSVRKENVATFYSIHLITDDNNKQSPYYMAKALKSVNGQMLEVDTLQKLITPRSYEKCNAKVYFKKCDISNKYKVGIIKCYKTPSDEEGINKKKQEKYDYFTSNDDEIFIADENQTIAFQAYFYEDLEKNIHLSQKKRQILPNEMPCINADELRWFINEKGHETLKGNPIFIKISDINKKLEFNFKNGDIIKIKAKLNPKEVSTVDKSSVYYKEFLKADGTLFKGTSHFAVNALGEFSLALEKQYALVYDYRGLFLYENRHELCELKIINLERKKLNLKDYLNTNKRYEAQITNMIGTMIAIHIPTDSNTVALMIECGDNIKHFKDKKINSTITLIYYEATKYVIFVERKHENPKYTLSDYTILEQKENYYQKVESAISSGVIVEPCGPDGLLANTLLRIPQGYYKIQQHETGAGLREYISAKNNEITRMLPILYDDEFVFKKENEAKQKYKNKHQARTTILIHSGTNILESPLDRTDGCLLIGKQFENKKFEEELLTHGNKNNILSIQDEIKEDFKEREHKFPKSSKNSKEYELLMNNIIKERKKMQKKYKENYKNTVDSYINESIRMLMSFIEQHKYKNFTVHIKNSFNKRTKR